MPGYKGLETVLHITANLYVNLNFMLSFTDYLMTWVQDQLDDEALFPSKIGVKFPPNFQVIVKTILKRLFRVYAHIYHQHFK